MLLLRRKQEPQPASEPAEPPKSEANPVPAGPASQTDAKDVAPESHPEAAPALSAAAVPEEVPMPIATNLSERHLLIATGISFRGEIAGCDRLVIDGAVEGEIKACRHIAVSDGGRFKGIAVAADADITGSCAGSLTVEERLFIGRTARVFGSVRYGRLAIEEGGELDGDVRRLRESGEALVPIKTAAPEHDPKEENVAELVADTVADAAAKQEAAELAELERMFAAAIAARDLSRFDEADSLFKAVIAKSPAHAAALANLGKLARQRGDRAEALSYFEAAAKADPQSAWARCDAAAMLHELGREAEADAIYKSVLEADPKHVGALSGLGHLVKERGEKTAALAHFEAAVAADPGNPWVRCDAASMLRDLGRHDDAEAMFKSVIETHPEHGSALTGLGHLARQRRAGQGRSAQSVGALRSREHSARAVPLRRGRDDAQGRS